MNRRQRRKQHVAKQLAFKSSPAAPAAGTPALPATAADTSEAPAQNMPENSLPVPGHATGPRTEEGKAQSSRNAVRHGLCAKKLTGSDLEALNSIRARLDHEWEPQTETEKMLLAQMALSQWRLERALELELAALDGGIDPAALALALRYRASAERTFFKSLSELQRLRQSMRQDAERESRREDEEETALLRQFEAELFKPYRQFVSQNGKPPAPLSQFVSQNAPPAPRTEAA